MDKPKNPRELIENYLDAVLADAGLYHEGGPMPIKGMLRESSQRVYSTSNGEVWAIKVERCFRSEE